MIRVLLADDQEMMRDALALLLNHSEAGMGIVGSVALKGDVCRSIEDTRPNVAVLGVPWRGGALGLDVARQALSIKPDIGLIMLFAVLDEELAYEAIQVGVRGLLLKESGTDALMQAIRMVAVGEMVLGPLLSTRLLEEYDRLAARSVKPLTARELEVLKLLAAGYSNKQIAGQLIVGEETIKAHVAAILQKLGVADRTQAALYAQRRGITSH